MKTDESKAADTERVCVSGWLQPWPAECQRAHGDGYLSAFPREFFDRRGGGKPGAARTRL